MNLNHEDTGQPHEGLGQPQVYEQTRQYSGTHIGKQTRLTLPPRSSPRQGYPVVSLGFEAFLGF